MSETDATPAKSLGKKARETKQPQAEAVRRRVPEVPRTSFNFIAQRWDVRRNRRRTALIVGLVVGSSLVGVGGLGFVAHQDVAAAKVEAVNLTEAARASESKLKELFGGATNISQRVAAGTNALRFILGQDIEPSTVVTQIFEATGPSIRIKNVTFAPGNSAPSAPPTTEAVLTAQPDAVTTKPVPATGPPTTLPPAVPGVRFDVTIQAEGSSYDDPPTWKQALSAIASLSKLEIAYSGDPASGLVLTARAVLVAPSGQPRLAALDDKPVSQSEPSHG